MTTHSRVRFILLAGFAGVVVTGCSSMPSPRELLGYPGEPAPSGSPRATEAKWLLIENPRLGDQRARIRLGRGGQGSHDDEVAGVRQVLPAGRARHRPQVRRAAGWRAHQPAAGRGLQGGEPGADGYYRLEGCGGCRA